MITEISQENVVCDKPEDSDEDEDDYGSEEEEKFFDYENYCKDVLERRKLSHIKANELYTERLNLLKSPLSVASLDLTSESFDLFIETIIYYC